MTVKLNKSGHVVIPKKVREQNGFIPGTEFELSEQGGNLMLAKITKCSKCKKILPKERAAHGICRECDPEFDDGFKRLY